MDFWGFENQSSLPGGGLGTFRFDPKVSGVPRQFSGTVLPLPQPAIPPRVAGQGPKFVPAIPPQAWQFVSPGATSGFSSGLLSSALNDQRLLRVQLALSSGNLELAVAILTEAASHTTGDSATPDATVRHFEVGAKTSPLGRALEAVIRATGVSPERVATLVAQTFSKLFPERVSVSDAVVVHEDVAVVASTPSRDRVIVRFLQLAQLSIAAQSREGLGVLTTLAAHGSSVQDLQTLNTAFERFLNLPEHARNTAINYVASYSASPTSGQVAAIVGFSLVVEALADSLLANPDGHQGAPREVAPESLPHPTEAPEARVVTESVVSPAVVAEVAPRRNDSSGLAEGTLPKALPKELQRSLGLPLYELLSALSAGQTTPQSSPLRPTFQRLAAGRVTDSEITALASQLISLPEGRSPMTVERVLRAWMHPRAQVRLLVIRYLAQLYRSRATSTPAMSASLPSSKVGKAGDLHVSLKVTGSEKEFPQALIALCRNRQLPFVQVEAIRVAIDIGGRHKNQEEMQALLEEIELVPTIARFLKSRDVAMRLEGLKLLAQAWAWIPEEARRRLAGEALRLAQTSVSEEVVFSALDVLLSHHQDLGAEMGRGLMARDIHAKLLMISSEKYARGWTNFAGQKNRPFFATGVSQRPDSLVSRQGSFVS